MDSHGSQNLLQNRDLLAQFFRHGLTVSFILCILLVPEGGGWKVEHHGQILRVFFFQNP